MKYWLPMYCLHYVFLQQEATNLDIAISQSSTSRNIHEVINAANQPNVMNKWIQFPKDIAELTNLRNG